MLTSIVTKQTKDDKTKQQQKISLWEADHTYFFSPIGLVIILGEI